MTRTRFTSDLHPAGISIDTIIEAKLQRFLHLGEKPILWAVADAMTSAGADSQQHLRRVTPSYIDRPTPFTLRAIGRWPGYVKPPRLSQWVGFKAVRGGSAGHYLEPIVFGGSRRQKRSEQRLNNAGVRERFLMPTGLSPARLNRYGNVSSGTYTQVLSQLKALSGPGVDANATSSRRSKAKRKARPFFLQKTSNGKRAIYARVGKRTIRPVFTLTDAAPRYRRQFPAQDILANRYQQRLSAALTLYLNRKLEKLT